MAGVAKALPDRILAYEHRTLSQSSLQNALELAEILPTGSKLQAAVYR